MSMTLGHLYQLQGWALEINLYLNQENWLLATDVSTVIRTTYLAELSFKAAWGKILTLGEIFVGGKTLDFEKCLGQVFLFC